MPKSVIAEGKTTNEAISNGLSKLNVSKDRVEIKITAEEICETLNKEPGNFIKDIMNDLEKQILLGKVKNENEEIKKYIKKNN